MAPLVSLRPSLLKQMCLLMPRKRGGFRVAGQTRDDTPTSNQVLVNVGTYGRGIVL